MRAPAPLRLSLGCRRGARSCFHRMVDDFQFCRHRDFSHCGLQN